MIHKTRDYLKKQFDTHHLSNYWDYFNKESREAIALNIFPTKIENLKLGQSRLGGQPDLPKNMDWFTDNQGTPLSFIAQINLSELAHFKTSDALPQKGVLYFFYAAWSDYFGFEAFGLESKDKDKFKVFYYEGDINELENKTFPSTLTTHYKPCEITFSPTISLPAAPHTIVQQEMGLEKSNDYWETLLDIDYEENQILGYSNFTDYDLELYCEFVTNGLDISTINAEDPKVKALEKNAKNWLLLFQVASNSEEADMNWGVMGNLYFWIKKEDLKHNRFENCWIQMTTK